MNIAIVYIPHQYQHKEKGFYKSLPKGLNGINYEMFPLEDCCKKIPQNSLNKFDIISVMGIKKDLDPRTHGIARLMSHYKHKKFLVSEAGYIGNRNKYYSIGFNGLNGRADFNNVGMPSERFDKLNIKLKNTWKPNGNILFCLQIPSDAAVNHLQYEDLIQNTIQKILTFSHKNIILRFHPKYNKSKRSHGNLLHDIACELSKHEKINISNNKSLQDDFKNTSCMVTVNSNSGVDALISGIPSIVLDEGSMIWDISSTDLSKVDTIKPVPDNVRLQKLYDIAYAEWNTEEIANGDPFKHLGII